MKKKTPKKSFTEILRSHPLPGVRLQRDRNGEKVVHLGRPGIFTHSIPLGTPAEEKTTETAASSVPAPSAAEELWLKGVEIWERAQVADFADRGALNRQAGEFFQKALDVDPSMTDAMLGIHATCPERRDEMAEVIFAGQDRFGETRNRFGRRLHSVYFPLVFSAEPLETADDLLRSRVKKMAVSGQFEEARNTLAMTEDCQLNDIAAIDILFHEQSYADAIVAIQAALGSPSMSRFLTDDLNLIQGVSFLRQGQSMIAIKMLEELADGANLQAVSHFARYELANLAIHEQAPILAREHLEILVSEDPGYRDARDKLASLAIGETPEPVTDEDKVFNSLITAFYSGEVADDPDLPDNQL